jgi:YHYH protein
MPRTSIAIAVLAAALLAAGCGSSMSSGASSVSTSTAASSSTSPSQATVATSTTVAMGTSATIVNVWKAPGSVKLTALPLGDNKESTTTPSVGNIYVCQAGDPSGPGSKVNGPWIHGTTWDETAKVVVHGSVTWPTASFSMKEQNGNRVFVTNDLPSGYKTGTFPIASSDPAYKYDTNPNGIKVQSAATVTLPIAPTASTAPNCLSGGAIGIMLNGVFLYNAVDATGRDAAAHEEQDACQGHPQDQGQYHYHEVPICLRDNTKGASTVVGYAYDGYPIVVERDAAGNLPNNGDLDVCHGRTSPILEDGKVVTTYHYDATLEFPYTVGCLHAASAVNAGP